MEIPQSYRELESILCNQYDEVDGCAFYQYIFPDNEKQGEMHTDFSKPNAIFLYKDEQDEGAERRLRRRVMLSDTWESDYMNYVECNPMTLCSGLSYRGRTNRLQNAQRMNALIFDLDGVGAHELQTLFVRFGQPANKVRTLPTPTFLVMSGAGVHLYYVFQEPIDLYPNIKLQLKALKYDLTFRIWEYKSTSTKQAIQYQSINQSFRMVGSINGKYGAPLRAFKIGEKVTLDHLNEYAKPENRVDINRPFRPSKMTRAQAKESYPEWYQRVVVGKKKGLKKWDIAGKVHGKDRFALYHWWLRYIGEIKGGHRYFYLMCMVIFACKNDVPREQLERDMYAAYEELRAVEHDNPLTEEDIKSALETYNREYYNFTLEDIEKITELNLPRNKRNYQKQKDHLEEARAIRDIRMKRQNRDWRDGNGRPSAAQTVIDYLREHPDATKAEVIRGTGLSKPTVYKHYEAAKEKAAEPEPQELPGFVQRMGRANRKAPSSR